eukprot:gene4943-6026_t
MCGVRWRGVEACEPVHEAACDSQVVATVPPVGALYGAPHGRKRTSMRHTRHYFVTGGMEEQAFAVVAGDIFFGTCSTDYYGTACEKDSVLDSEDASALMAWYIPTDGAP